MMIKEYYNVEIPEGYRIFEKEFEISGIQYKKENLIKVMKKGALVEFSLRHDPQNPKDKNAIEVIAKRKGFFGKVEKSIGFIPAKISSHIADTKLISKLLIRPKRLYISEKGFVEYIIDLLGPKDLYEQYKNI
jgi:hypothetical protein